MARESFDSLKDLPRVPHAEGNAHTAIQVGVGGNPPDRKYVTYGDAVDNSVAVARLNARRKGEMPVIPGGLDDHDPRLFVTPEAVAPMAKMKVAQSKPLTEEDVKRLKSEPKQDVKPPTNEHEQKIVLKPVKETVDEVLQEMGGPAGSVPHGPDENSGVHGGAQITGRQGMPGVYPNHVDVEYRSPNVVVVEKPVEKVVEKIVEKETEATRWLKQRTRVEIGTSETTFHVSAIAAIMSIHAVTIILPTANDAMTFVPRIGAKVKIKCKDSDVIDTIFTGASFEIPELGILGLAFLIPKGDED